MPEATTQSSATDSWTAAANVGAGIMGLTSANDVKQAQKDANRTNILLARENRQWKEKMSNTAHRRESHDLKQAGLNRILGYSKGSGGAQTPSHTTATVESTAKDSHKVGAQVAQTAAQIANLTRDTQIKKETINKIASETVLIDETAKTQQTTAAKNEAETAFTKQKMLSMSPLPALIESTGLVPAIQKGGKAIQTGIQKARNPATDLLEWIFQGKKTAPGYNKFNKHNPNDSRTWRKKK